MPSYAAEATVKRPPISPAASFGLSPIDRESIGNLVGHTLACIEREFILQTSRSHREIEPAQPTDWEFQFDRCGTKIRDYRGCGESVPEPANLAS
jgi:hypothetical protein